MLQAKKSVRLTLISIMLIANCFVIGLLTYALDAAKKQQEREVRTSIENLALLLDQNITTFASKIDLSLTEIADHLEQDMSRQDTSDTKQTSAQINAMLAMRRDWLAGLVDLRATDSSGTVRYGTGVTPASSTSYADRGFYLAHQTRKDSGLIVTDPIFGRVSKVWVIAFTRRYNRPDGSFAGVISAAVPVSHFARLISGLDLGPNGFALLRDSTTGLIARHPALSTQPIGTKSYSTDLAGIFTSGVVVATYHAERSGDGMERTNTYRRLSAVPFHLVAGMATEDYLDSWRNSVRKAIAAAAIFLLFSAILTWFMWRSFNQIRDASERNRTLVERASDGIHVLDESGRIVEASDSFCRMLGYTRDEVIGMHISNWNPGSASIDMSKEIARFLEQGDVHTLETRHLRKDGGTFDVEITVYALTVDRKPLLYASSRDITDRKHAEEEVRRVNEELRQVNETLELRVGERTSLLESAKLALESSSEELTRSNRELEQFAYVASHDLQEPVRTVVGFVQLLEKRLAGKLDPESLEFMNYAVTGALHMRTMIQGILAYSRIGTNGLPLLPVESADAVQDALALLHNRIVNAGAEIEVASLPAVLADRTQLEQLLENLIGNAIKYCREDVPRVRIEARRDGAQWRFTITDNGIGIDHEFRERIFVMFQRLHTRDEFEGTGLGLAICKRIVQRHGGQIGVDPAPGGGSAFWFTLPAEKG
jgi:PAS domain S-box-containing protein